MKGDNTYYVYETETQYVVEEYAVAAASSSRNRNINDRRSRLAALDVIGSYILFKDWSAQQGRDNRYFQAFSDAAALHYNAEVVGFSPETCSEGKSLYTRWACDKSDYNMVSASYRDVTDTAELLEAAYSRGSNADNAALLYEYDPSPAKYFSLQRDFLSGNASVPAEVREGRSREDVFSQSLYSEELTTVVSFSIEGPFLLFSLADMTTSAPFPVKQEYFAKWKSALGSSLWEDVLVFCADKCQSPLPQDPTVSEVIMAFPGCLNPNLMRKASFEPGYDKGAAAYSQSDFEGAIAALSESIDIDGLSTRTLNLLGGAYRLNSQPDKALPFLLLCAAIEPSTQYLCGNIVLCLNALQYPRIQEICDGLKPFAKDSWSANQLSNL